MESNKERETLSMCKVLSPPYGMTIGGLYQASKPRAPQVLRRACSSFSEGFSTRGEIALLSTWRRARPLGGLCNVPRGGALQRGGGFAARLPERGGFAVGKESARTHLLAFSPGFAAAGGLFRSVSLARSPLLPALPVPESRRDCAGGGGEGGLHVVCGMAGGRAVRTAPPKPWAGSLWQKSRGSRRRLARAGPLPAGSRSAAVLRGTASFLLLRLGRVGLRPGRAQRCSALLLAFRRQAGSPLTAAVTRVP